MHQPLTLNKLLVKKCNFYQFIYFSSNNLSAQKKKIPKVVLRCKSFASPIHGFNKRPCANFIDLAQLGHTERTS